MMNEVNNAMFSKKFDYGNNVSSIVNNFKDETYNSSPFLPPNGNIMFPQPGGFGSIYGNGPTPMSMYPMYDPRYNDHYNGRHPSYFPNDNVASKKSRLHGIIKKAKENVDVRKSVKVENGESNSTCESIQSGSDWAHASPILLCESSEDSDDDTIMDVKLPNKDKSTKENNND